MIKCQLGIIIFFLLAQLSLQVCPFLAHCLQCTDPAICQQCKPNYITVNDICTIQVVSNSIDQDGEFSTSSTRQDNYYARSQTLTFSGIGADPTNSCAFWLKDLQICAFCNQGYELIVGKCHKKLQKCQQFEEGIKCKKCIKNLFLESNGNCIDLNCQRSGYYNCDQCKKGYTKNFYHVCLDPNCQTYDNGKCTKCGRGFQLQSDLCIRINSTVITVTNITSKITTTTVSNTTKTTIIKVHSGCLLYDLRGGCHRCIDSFFLNEGQCRTVDRFCQIYDSLNGTCFICKENYELINSRCVSDDPSKNCEILQEKQCQKCIDRYYLMKGVCLQVDPSCFLYNQTNGFCLSCRDGYRLVGNRCLLIFSRSGDDQDNETSLVNQFSKFYCLKYRQNTNYCETCYARFYASEGFCWRVNPLCRTYNNQQGYCQSCYQGYRLEDRTCLVDFSTNPLLNCKQYSPETSLCLSCVKRYFLFQGICLQVYPECKDYDEKTGQCTSCFNGYFLLDGLCQIVATALSVPFCQNYNPLDPRQCLKCVSGYYLQSNTCLNVSPLCGDYDDTNGFCENCISDRYQLVNGRCLQRMENCEKLMGEKMCQRCKSGYILVKGICLK